MTAQMMHFIKFNDIEYNLIEVEFPQSWFNPKSFGLKPRSIITFCSDGYLCDFTIVKDMLMLKTLNVNLADDSTQTFLNLIPTNRDKRVLFAKSYDDIFYHINYSGRIIIVRDKIKKLGVYYGYPPTWAFHEVLELTFHKGKLISTEDRSVAMAKLRCKEEKWCNKRILRTKEEQGLYTDYIKDEEY